MEPKSRKIDLFDFQRGEALRVYDPQPGDMDELLIANGKPCDCEDCRGGPRPFARWPDGRAVLFPSGTHSALDTGTVWLLRLFRVERTYAVAQPIKRVDFATHREV